MRAVLCCVAIVFATPGWAQNTNGTTTTTQPTVTQGTSSAASNLRGSPVQRLLADGYEVKAGFSDNNGGAYMVLQKATSAYMCHSNPTATCEKLN